MESYVFCFFLCLGPFWPNGYEGREARRSECLLYVTGTVYSDYSVNGSNSLQLPARALTFILRNDHNYDREGV